MKIKFGIISIAVVLLSCDQQSGMENTKKSSRPIAGTWKLITGTLIEKNDTTRTDYTKNISFIKIINDNHFAFLQHDLSKGKDSPAVFSSGGGSYTLKDSSYTEHLEYCSDRNWEGNDFTFTISVNGDTLVQSGIEKIEGTGINRINVEQYVRLKN